MSYQDFVSRKLELSPPTGLPVVPELSDALYKPHQQALTKWALRRGRSAIFADTGLGKTRMELAWAKAVSDFMSGSPILILTPLAVAAQSVREAELLGMDLNHCRTDSDIRHGLNVINYDRLHLIDPERFSGIVLDESSCIKHNDTKTLARLLEMFRATPFKLCATATPAPNDWTELGTHAEFLGICSRAEMLAEYFVHDGGETQVWRLKGHARPMFWRWVASWGAMVRKPSDLGYNDEGYILPPLHIHDHIVDSALEAQDGFLFAMEASTLMERRDARRASMPQRVQACANAVNARDEQELIWCDLNAESEALTRAIEGAVEVTGSDSVEHKEAAIEWFVGNICDCQLSAKSSKLSGWIKRRQTVTNPSTTGSTVQNDSKLQSSISARTEKSGANTCAPTTTKTKQPNGAIERQNSGSDTTQSEGANMQKIRHSESDASSSQKLIQSGANITGSDLSSASTRPLIRQCSMANSEDALSVGGNRQTDEAINSPSIIAIPAGKSEGCFVDHATSDSGNSTTTQNDSNEPPCTCGGIKSKRVLISKPSIFGFGLNLQGCARQSFVGLTDSYEAYYQAVRRSWRFGQTRPVHVDIYASAYEGPVLANIRRKEADAADMGESLAAETGAAVRESVLGVERQTNPYNANVAIKAPAWLETCND